MKNFDVRLGDMLEIEPFTLNGVEFSSSTLSLKPVRRFLENLMCLMIEAEHEMPQLMTRQKC